jgi:hypothetical protein
MGDNGEATDQDVAGGVFVEGPADADDVFDCRRTYVEAIILVIHSSASSKLRNLYTPDGTSLSVPRIAQAVRSRRSASSGVVRPIFRRPTVFVLKPVSLSLAILRS